MSVPYSTITCSDCDLVGTTLVTVGLFRWRDEQGRQCHMDRGLGLCRACDGIVAMEVLPTPESIEEAKREAREHRAYNARLTSPWGRLKNALSSMPRRPVKVDEPEVLEAVRRLGRRPVCLACGSTEVDALPRPKGVTAQDESLHRLGMRHSGCGGELLVHGSGRDRIAPRQMVRTYDIHGRLIEQIPYEIWRRERA